MAHTMRSFRRDAEIAKDHRAHDSAYEESEHTLSLETEKSIEREEQHTMRRLRHEKH